MFAKIYGFFRQDPLLSLSLLAALVTSMFHSPRAGAIDFKVIICLFMLMLTAKGLETSGLLHRTAALLIRKCGDTRSLTVALCLLAFFSSMAVTNDIAVLALLPLLFALSDESGMGMLLPAVLVTLCANMGSSATPFGNPQNLFLYSFYRMESGEFFSISLLPAFAGLAAVLAAAMLRRKKTLKAKPPSSGRFDSREAAVFLILTAAAILGVIGAVSYPAAAAAILAVTVIYRRRLLLQMDYRLLGAFALLFIAVDNISHAPAVRELISGLTATPQGTYFSGIGLSQFISNVPAAILLASFTAQRKALLWGVNIGGLGTLVASLANLIAYRLYNRRHPHGARYFLKLFTAVNLICLLILGTVFRFLL